LRRESDQFVCADCDGTFDVEDGVPVLVPEKERPYFEFLNGEQMAFGAERADELYTADKKSYRNCIDLLSETDEVETVVDLGTGYGGLARNLAAAGYEPTCLDVNVARVKTVQDRGHRAAVAVSSDLPFPSGSVDAVCVISALPHLRDVETTFRELNRILRPGGALIVDFYNILNVLWRLFMLVGRWEPIAARQGWHYFQSTLSAQQLRKLADSTGFRVESDGSYTPVPKSSRFVRLPATRLSCLRHAFRLTKTADASN